MHSRSCFIFGLPITVLVRKTGIAYSSWQRWRNGEISPTLRSVQVIANRLGYSPGVVCEELLKWINCEV